MTHIHTWHQVVALEYLGAALRPLRLQLEQNTAARLLRLADALQRAAQPLLLELETRRAAAKAAAAEGAQVRGRQPLELYLKTLELHPINVRVSVQMGVACDEAEMQEWRRGRSKRAAREAWPPLCSRRQRCARWL